MEPTPASATGPRGVTRRRWLALILLGAVAIGGYYVLSWRSGYVHRIFADDRGAVVVLLGDGAASMVRVGPSLWPKWRVRLDNATVGTIESITVGPEHVAVIHSGSSQRLSVHLLESGKTLWEAPADLSTSLFVPKLWIHRHLLLTFEAGGVHEDIAVHAYALASGEHVWNAELPTDRYLAIHERDGLWWFQGSNELVAIDAATGESVVRNDRVSSLCVDGDRVYATGRTDVVLRSLSMPEPQHAWALPLSLQGASIVRCGRYADFDVLTFAYDGGLDRHLLALATMDGETMGMMGDLIRGHIPSTSILFIDRRSQSLAELVDLGAPLGDGNPLELMDGCHESGDHDAQGSTGGRCPMSGELTRFVPLLARAIEGEEMSMRVLILDLRARAVVGGYAASWPGDGLMVARHEDTYVAVAMENHNFIVVDGHTGARSRHAFRPPSPSRSWQSAVSFDHGSLWLAVEGRVSRFELSDELREAATHRGGVSARLDDDEQPMMADVRTTARTLDVVRHDIAPLYTRASTVSTGNESIPPWARGAAPFEAEWVRIEPGSYRTMTNVGPLARELGERLVVLTRAYWMMTTTVTREQWNQVMDRPAPVADDYILDQCIAPECPVMLAPSGNGWRSMLEFANRVSVAAGLSPCYDLDDPDSGIVESTCEGFRLPTAAEWENAALAGDDNLVPCGSDPCTSNCPLTYRSVANAFGIRYDLARRRGISELQWELTGDGWMPFYAGREVDPVVPLATDDQPGGDPPSSWRSARYVGIGCAEGLTNREPFADALSSSSGLRIVGFRLVRTAPPS